MCMYKYINDADCIAAIATDVCVCLYVFIYVSYVYIYIYVHTKSSLIFLYMRMHICIHSTNCLAAIATDPWPSFIVLKPEWLLTMSPRLLRATVTCSSTCPLRLNIQSTWELIGTDTYIYTHISTHTHTYIRSTSAGYCDILLNLSIVFE